MNKWKKFYISMLLCTLITIFTTKLTLADVGDVVSGYWPSTVSPNFTVQLDSRTGWYFYDLMSTASFAWNNIDSNLRVTSFSYNDYSSIGFTEEIRVKGEALYSRYDHAYGMCLNYYKTWYGGIAGDSNWNQKWVHSLIRLDTEVLRTRATQDQMKTLTHELGHSFGLNDVVWEPTHDGVPSIMYKGEQSYYVPQQHDKNNIMYKY